MTHRRAQNDVTLNIDGRSWEFDREFLTSNWQCIWDDGCAGIEQAPNAAKGLGCCSVGAEMLDEDEAMKITALGATLTPARCQFSHEIETGGVLREVNTDRARWATRIVDGACIFLNRPGFAGGHGCALHHEAVEAQEAPLDWKPSVCWQLPLKVEELDDDRLRLRRWLRSDWGPEGHSMAYCCTERPAEQPNAGEQPNAYGADRPVHETLSAELEALLGSALFAQLKDELDSGG